MKPGSYARYVIEYVIELQLSITSWIKLETDTGFLVLIRLIDD